MRKAVHLRLTSYAVAIAAVAITMLVRIALGPVLVDRARYIPFMVAVVVAGVFGGTLPAILAALLSAGAVVWMFGIGHPGAPLELVAFFLASGAITFVIAQAARWRRKSDESADELNLLLDGAEGFAIYMLDPQGRVTIWNKSAERLTGWTAEEAVGEHARIFYPRAARAAGKPESDLARACGEGKMVEEDWRVRRNGSEFLAHATLAPVHADDDGLRGFAMMLRDVTVQRAVERQLTASANQFRSVLATVPDAMIVIDERARILSFSAAAERLFGYAEAEVAGTNIRQLMPSPDHEQHDGYIRHYLETGERRIVGQGARHVLGRRRDGTTFPIELVVGEAITDGERIFTGFIRDLTEKQRAEARIEELREELIHAARVSAMGTMASTLAHELNQPIAAVVNYVAGARNLMDGGDPAELPAIRDALGEASGEAMRAGAILRRLREFVARGDTEKAVEDLPALIDEAAKLALIGAREKGVEVGFDLDPQATPVFVDKVQIQQVLINLMRNAIEAMSGTPVRRLAVSTAPEAPGHVRVTVADTGTGVSSGIAENLFRAFNSNKRGGMGLGLSICRTIVEANGGHIWMEPREGGGSLFHFTLVRMETELPE